MDGPTKEPTDAERRLLWDDELEQMTRDAAAIHGTQTVADFVEFAVGQLIADSRGKWLLAASDLKAAMKAELQRLLQPH